MRIASEKEREDEVDAAYESFKTARKKNGAITINVVDKAFSLYSLGHTNKFYSDLDDNSP